jgi:5-methylcytosine-specific restriction enzyme subunit McrC
MKIPIQNIYYLLCYAWNRLDERDIVDVHGIDTTSLVDLFAKVLIGGMCHLLKRGLDRGYISRSEEGRCIKGKLNFGPTIKQNLFIQAKVFCDYDELSHNVLHNQILKATIRCLTTVSSLNKDLKEQLIGLQRRLHGIDDVGLNSRLFSSVQLNRNNSFYDFLLKICELVYENLLPTEDPGRTKFRDFLQDEKKMRALFEEFVRNFYIIEANDCIVRREDIAWHAKALDDKAEKFLPKMITDISIEKDNTKAIIDTKYYKEALVTHYEQEKIHPGHLYQLHAYLSNLEHKGGINLNCSGVLLYPTVDAEYCLPYQFGKHRLTVCTINLNQDWTSIQKDLMNILYGALTVSPN